MRLKSLKCLWSIIPAVIFLPLATAGTITFGESPATNNGAAYSATVLGATFSATNAGTWGGNSNGNPGGWGLEGTNSPEFLGFNGGYSEAVTFASGTSSISLDFSRSSGSSDGTVTLQALNGVTILGSTSAILGPINTWSTLSLAFPVITSISWSGTGTGFHPYGVDNLTFGAAPAAVPEPSSAVLLTGGLLCLASFRRLVRR
jgi:hypothetical protein